MFIDTSLRPLQASKSTRSCMSRGFHSSNLALYNTKNKVSNTKLLENAALHVPRSLRRPAEVNQRCFVHFFSFKGLMTTCGYHTDPFGVYQLDWTYTCNFKEHCYTYTDLPKYILRVYNIYRDIRLVKRNERSDVTQLKCLLFISHHT